MGKISYEERKKNFKLTSFDDLKEAVIANVIKKKPASEKKEFKEEEENKTLGDFS